MIHWTTLAMAYLLIGAYVGFCVARTGWREARGVYSFGLTLVACTYLAIRESVIWLPYLLATVSRHAFPHPDDEEDE